MDREARGAEPRSGRRHLGAGDRVTQVGEAREGEADAGARPVDLHDHRKAQPVVPDEIMIELITYAVAGMGDLILTCYGAQSRNRRVGFELGQGRSLTEILAGMTMVAEGVGTTAALLALARENRIELPITQQVHSILHLGNSPREAIRAIMERPLKRE